MTEPFRVAEIPKAGLVGRLLGRVPHEAIFVELRNLLATTPFERVRPNDVANILATGHLRPRDVTKELLGIFEQAIHIRCADHGLSHEDRRALFLLQHAFEISDVEGSEAIERVLDAIYERALHEALAGGTFTATDRARLESLAATLGLTDAQQKRLYAQAARDALHAAYQLAAGDGRLDSGEEARITALATALDVTFTLDDTMATIINRARLLAQLDEGHLPSLTVPLLLGRGELCHFAAPSVAQLEMRVVTKRINYSGPTASIRIVKGLRWRMGSISIQRVTQDVLSKIDTGDFYITSKRVFFQGARKNTSLQLSKVMHFQVYKDGIQIDKQTGKDLYCIGAGDWELAGSCLDAAIRTGR